MEPPLILNNGEAWENIVANSVKVIKWEQYDWVASFTFLDLKKKYSRGTYYDSAGNGDIRIDHYGVV